MVGRTELARAATWDAARAVGDAETESFAAAAAGSLAIDGYFLTAKDCVQTLGGIGFTWEHDAHVYLRRAMATRALLGSARRGRSASRSSRSVARSAGSAWTCRPKRKRIARSCARCWPSSRSWSRWSSAAGGGRGVRAAAVAEAVGPGRGRARAAGHRRRVPPRRDDPAEHRGRRLGPPAADGLRDRGAAAALDPADAAGRDRVVPAVQRARCGFGPRVAHDPGRARRGRLAGQRAEGLDVDGRAGRLGHPARPHRPGGRRSTKASRSSCST